jgi:hypothetical protein
VRSAITCGNLGGGVDGDAAFEIAVAEGDGEGVERPLAVTARQFRGGAEVGQLRRREARAAWRRRATSEDRRRRHQDAIAAKGPPHDHAFHLAGTVGPLNDLRDKQKP